MMKLRKWMDNRKKVVTVSDIAKRCGVSRRAVYNWLDEISPVVPQYAQAQKIAKMTGNKVNRKDFL